MYTYCLKCYQIKILYISHMVKYCNKLCVIMNNHYCYMSGCQCPTAPRNGYTRSCSDTDPVGSYVNYYCYNGYALIGGLRSRRCQSSYNWTGTEPRCLRSEYMHRNSSHVDLSVGIGTEVSLTYAWVMM